MFKSTFFSNMFFFNYDLLKNYYGNRYKFFFSLILSKLLNTEFSCAKIKKNLIFISREKDF